MVENANSHAFSYVPQVVREQRKKENCLTEIKGVIRPAKPYVLVIVERDFIIMTSLLIILSKFMRANKRKGRIKYNQLEGR